MYIGVNHTVVFSCSEFESKVYPGFRTHSSLVVKQYPRATRSALQGGHQEMGYLDLDGLVEKYVSKFPHEVGLPRAGSLQWGLFSDLAEREDI